MYTWALLLLVFFIGSMSIWQRTRYLQRLSKGETKSSLLSQAIGDLVAMSGGIYMALGMLVSFLKLDIPGQVFIYQVTIDPLACIAIGLAIIQPLFIKEE